MTDWPSARTFKEDDFLAFLTYAGKPPPIFRPAARPSATNLTARVDYLEKCNDFCAEYFNECDARYIGFHSRFLEWYRCQQAIKEEAAKPFSLSKENDND